MNTKKTVNAFTLVEMVIVLIIASLIVALSFTVLDIVQRNLGNISKQFSVENNRILLQSRLEANFLKYGESYYDRNKEQIVFRSNIDSIIYRLNNDFLIMEDDTIDFKFQKIYFMYHGDSIANGGFDAIGTIQKESAKKIFCYRVNDSKAYLNGLESKNR